MVGIRHILRPVRTGLGSYRSWIDGVLAVVDHPDPGEESRHAVGRRDCPSCGEAAKIAGCCGGLLQARPCRCVTTINRESGQCLEQFTLLSQFSAVNSGTRYQLVGEKITIVENCRFVGHADESMGHAAPHPTLD